MVIENHEAALDIQSLKVLKVSDFHHIDTPMSVHEVHFIIGDGVRPRTAVDDVASFQFGQLNRRRGGGFAFVFLFVFGSFVAVVFIVAIGLVGVPSVVIIVIIVATTTVVRIAMLAVGDCRIRVFDTSFFIGIVGVEVVVFCILREPVSCFDGAISSCSMQ